MSVRLFLSCFLPIFHYIRAEESCLPLITAGPVDMSVSVNEIASFTCTAINVEYIYWLVNNETIDRIPGLDDFCKHVVTNNERTSTIEFKVDQNLNTDLLNKALVTCIGYCLQEDGTVKFSKQSPPAILFVQGKPDPPSTVNATYDGSVFEMEWLPPFVLEGIKVSYIIEITVVTVFGEEIVILEFPVNFATASVEYVDNGSCRVYNTCVAAITKAGQGKPSCITPIKIGATKTLATTSCEIQPASSGMNIQTSKIVLDDSPSANPSSLSATVMRKYAGGEARGATNTPSIVVLLLLLMFVLKLIF